MASFLGVGISFALVLRAIGIFILLSVLRFFYLLCQVRSNVRNVAKKYNIPILPHSFLFGHLPVIGKIMAKYPPDTNAQYVPILLRQDYPEICAAGLVYMDVWPISPPMLTVFHPDVMAQFCQETSLPKHELLHTEFQPFTQCKDLVNQEGEEWKAWRSIFNPGFSAKNLLSLVPAMLEEIQVFKEWLKDVAKLGEVTRLEDQAMKATIDVIGRAVLGSRLQCQTASNPLYKAMKNQVSWLIFDNTPRSLGRYFNPFRQLIMWNNNRIMKNYLLPHIERGIAEYDKFEGPKTINNLAIKSYVSGVQDLSSRGKIDSYFINTVIAQMKIFIFAGHDTTASTISFAFHLLYNNPAALGAMRTEHESVFGPDPTEAATKITASPALLNQLPYTSAVIKETLRLFPPFGSVRAGQPGFFLTHPDTGERYPTEGFMLFSCSLAEQRHDAFWPRANEFVPERWLARDGEPLHVRKNAFRPFELGPRNCIGQELAQLELRMILVLTARELDIESVYPEDGGRLLGELCYQVMAAGEITAHPKGGMPVRVKIRG